jgi:hypothetical protein
MSFKATTTQAFAEMVHGMQREVDSFMRSFTDDPARLSGWGHAYFCDEDGGRLLFDPKRPHRHVCSVCKRVYSGIAYDAAWVYFYRNLAIVTAWKAALLYRTNGQTKYLAYAKTIVSYYAERYHLFALHDKEGRVYEEGTAPAWGCGRIMPQGLNESIFAIRMLWTLELLKTELSAVFLDLVRARMFDQFQHLVRPQVDAVHNIRCWNLAALGCAALFFHDKGLLDFVFTGEFNIGRQLREGVTADGFWYEGSIHYHYFLLEGVLSLMLMCDAYGHDFGKAETAIVERMLAAGYDQAFDNHRFPLPNDGWPDLNLKTFVHVYHMAAKFFGEDSRIGNLLKNIEGDHSKRTTLPLSEPYYWDNRIPLEHLLFTSEFDLEAYVPLRRSSSNRPHSNFAILRNGPLNVFVKYGLNGPSHAHPDIMNVEVAYGAWMVSRDLSNAGYRSFMCNHWQRATVSHSTVACGGRNQAATHGGTCLHFDDTSIHAAVQEVYPGVDYERSLSIAADHLQDSFMVTDRNQVGQTIDYLFHLESDFRVRLMEPGASMVPAVIEEQTDGYRFITDVKEVVTHAKTVTWHAANEGVGITLTFTVQPQQRLLVARSPDNPVNRTRTTFIVRDRGPQATFSLRLGFTQL